MVLRNDSVFQQGWLHVRWMAVGVAAVKVAVDTYHAYAMFGMLIIVCADD
jgi:hypothetical protein